MKFRLYIYKAYSPTVDTALSRYEEEKICKPQSVTNTREMLIMMEGQNTEENGRFYAAENPFKHHHIIAECMSLLHASGS